MKKLLIGLLLLSSCAFDPAIVHRSSIRRAAGAKLWTCLQANPILRDECLSDQRAYCHSQNMEPNCGVDDAWDVYFSKKARNR
jgi:hypothetical protein